MNAPIQRYKYNVKISLSDHVITSIVVKSIIYHFFDYRAITVRRHNYRAIKRRSGDYRTFFVNFRNNRDNQTMIVSHGD